jgi:6-pyruvoyltetrahydropterin/6-carboxytetrahydropterin synthase
MGYAVERYHDISCGHRVHGHESKCAHLHGHNYRVTFTCIPASDNTPVQRKFFGAQAQQPSDLDEVGRVIDFSDIKSKLCMWLEEEWDHKFLVWMHDPLAGHLCQLDPAGVVVVPFNPTAENMAAYLVDVVAPQQLAGTGVRLMAVKVEETRKCSATYTAALGER